MKKYCSLLCLALSCLLFCSCGNSRYRDDLACADIALAAESEISLSGGFSELSRQDTELLLGDNLFDSSFVIYSKSGDDISEIGVLHAPNDTDAHRLLQQTVAYIEEQKVEKNSFLQNYLPSELEKLNNAEARRFGNYVVYTILEDGDANKVFDKAEMLLRE